MLQCGIGKAFKLPTPKIGEAANLRPPMLYYLILKLLTLVYFIFKILLNQSQNSLFLGNIVAQ